MTSSGVESAVAEVARSLSGRTALITGGTGFVGANLTRTLLLAGCRVHLLLGPAARPWRLQTVIDEATAHLCNLADTGEVLSCIASVEPDVVFHLAAHGAYPAETDLHRMLEINIAGTANLLSALRDTRGRCRLVYTGSSSEYGYKSHAMAESDLLEPASFYAVSKAAGSHLCQVFAHTHGQPAVIVRLFSIYGYYEEPSRFIPTAVLAALRRRPLHLHTGSESRDYVFVEDAVEALLLAATVRGVEGEIFNIGSGQQTTTRQVADIVQTVTGIPLDVRIGSYPARPWETSFWLADTRKAAEGLGWRARHSMADGLARTIDWFSKEEHARLYS